MVCKYFLSFHRLAFFLEGRAHMWHIEVPRLWVESELQLEAYATAMQDPSHVCDLYHSSWQCQILNPLNEARDPTHNLMVPSRICFLGTIAETPKWRCELNVEMGFGALGPQQDRDPSSVHGRCLEGGDQTAGPGEENRLG